MDKNYRTIVKTLSYRTAGLLSIFLLSYLLGYGSGFALKLVVASYTIGFVSYLIHEYIWNRVNWDRLNESDSKRRSIVKTITWRVYSFIVLFFIGKALGLDNSSSLEWTIYRNIAFIVTHYVHERVWNIIKWGKSEV